MTNVAYWVPKDKPDTLVYLLAHKNRAAADASWKAFIADPEWQAVFKASETSAGVRLPSKIESVFMDATDYSPLK
jgi:NIPSNAP